MNLDTNTQNLTKFRREVSSISAASRPIDHYLIDTENMGRDWVELLDKHENAIYHIFYTEKSPAIPIECIERMMEKQESIKFIKCYTGANALDFQLVTQLGYMLATMPEDHYHIVSRDTGYDAVVKFWGERGIAVERVSQLQSTPVEMSDDNLEVEQLCRDALREIASDAEIGIAVRFILETVEEELSQYKVVVHTKLVKQFSQIQGSAIYNACKNIIERVYLNRLLQRKAS